MVLVGGFRVPPRDGRALSLRYVGAWCGRWGFVCINAFQICARVLAVRCAGRDAVVVSEARVARRQGRNNHRLKECYGRLPSSVVCCDRGDERKAGDAACMFQSVPWQWGRWGNLSQEEPPPEPPPENFDWVRSLLATAPERDITPMRDAIMMLDRCILAGCSEPA